MTDARDGDAFLREQLLHFLQIETGCSSCTA